MNIRIYDNEGETFDRYTVVYLDEQDGTGKYTYVGMSRDPFHPQGFGQHGTCIDGPHLGKRIEFHDLPQPCQRLVMYDLLGM